MKEALIKSGVDFGIFTVLFVSNPFFSAFITAIIGAMGVALVNLAFVPLVKWIIKKIKTWYSDKTNAK